MEKDVLINKDSLATFYWSEGLSTYQIGQKLGCSPCKILRLMREEGIPRRTISEARKGHPTGFNYPDLTLNENMAYILGVLKGDGCVHKVKNNLTRMIILNVKDKDFALSFFEALNQIGLNPEFREPKSYDPLYLVRAYSAIFGEWYEGLTLSDIERMLESSPELMRAFIRGFYDSDGNFKHRGYQWLIRFANTDLALLEMVKRLLEKLSFHPYINARKPFENPNWSQAYDLCLSRKAEVRRFIAEIGSSIPRKQAVIIAWRKTS